MSLPYLLQSRLGTPFACITLSREKDFRSAIGRTQTVPSGERGALELGAPRSPGEGHSPVLRVAPATPGMLQSTIRIR